VPALPKSKMKEGSHVTSRLRSGREIIENIIELNQSKQALPRNTPVRRFILDP
jgi:hypothetical protein